MKAKAKQTKVPPPAKATTKATSKVTAIAKAIAKTIVIEKINAITKVHEHAPAAKTTAIIAKQSSSKSSSKSNSKSNNQNNSNRKNQK